VFKGHCVGFEKVPEFDLFAESAKHVREFVRQRSSPHVATEATGVAGGLGRRELHNVEQSYPRSRPHVKKHRSPEWPNHRYFRLQPHFSV
jgi:hypothetical protein